MIDDYELQLAVLAELSWEPSVTAAHIGVTASAGVVTLTGHVGTFAQKHAAEAAARRVKGVLAVAEEIEVRLTFETTRSDGEIAAAALDRFAWDVSVPRDAITVNVEKGWVTLTGQVDWFYQKDAAHADLRGLWGVVGVSDQVTIRPRIDTAGIHDTITHALERSWAYHPGRVTVRAENGHVRLSGTVHSPYDRQVAVDTAWAASGVTGVENDIVIA